MNNTRDLAAFGHRERAMAGELLTALSTQGKPEEMWGDGVTVEFNPMSGSVFLVDEDYNVAMMNGDVLETWFSCPYCGHEGFREDMEHDAENEECSRYLRDIGVSEEE